MKKLGYRERKRQYRQFRAKPNAIKRAEEQAKLDFVKQATK